MAASKLSICLPSPQSQVPSPQPAVHRQYNEDLFESTKMTFGEHLDELRQTLIKSIIALFIGVLIGLFFARDVVQYVQMPLKEALKEHYSKVAAKEYRQHLIEQAARGEQVPEDLDAAEKLFKEQRLVTEEHLVDPRDLAELLKKAFPQAIDTSKLPVSRPGIVEPDKLVKQRSYHLVDDDPRVRIIALSAEEPFIIVIKAAIMTGAILASPFIFYFIWQFVAAGLYPHEQYYVRVFLPFSTGLFLAGAALAFFVVFKFVLRFLFGIAGLTGIEVEPRITEWLSFVLILPLGFGLAFQLPLVMLFLERIGILSIATYLSNWRMSVLVIAFLAMIFTPSDPYSMLLMMLPLIALYFFGIGLCKWMPKRAAAFDLAE
jgi:sec-independent protein translocase protein TatC